MQEDIQELDPADAEAVSPDDLDEITTTGVVARPSAPPRLSSSPPPVPVGLRPSSSPPPLPSRASAPPGTQSSLAALSDLRRKLAETAAELKEASDHRDRIRLGILQRDDRIRELESRLSEAQARASAAERRADDAEARCSQAERAATEQRTSTAPPVVDDLRALPGVGAVFERALRAAGIHSFGQIAAWEPDDVDRVARLIKTTPARIQRAGWVERARELSADRQPG